MALTSKRCTSLDLPLVANPFLGLSGIRAQAVSHIHLPPSNKSNLLHLHLNGCNLVA